MDDEHFPETEVDEMGPGAPVSEEKEQEGGEERRQDYRLNKVLGATLIPDAGESKSARLFVIDISTSGFRATDHQAPTESECVIQIVFEKGEDPFESRMRVVWVKELTVSGMFQMGCEFLDTPESQKTKLNDFIAAERARVEPPRSSVLDLGRRWTMIS